MVDKKQVTEISDDKIKFVAWALGLGAGATFMLLTYALATFTTKEASASNQKLVDQEISTLKSSVTEIKESNKDFQKWLRDNWHKRNPGKE